MPCVARCKADWTPQTAGKSQPGRRWAAKIKLAWLQERTAIGAHTREANSPTPQRECRDKLWHKGRPACAWFGLVAVFVR